MASRPSGLYTITAAATVAPLPQELGLIDVDVVAVADLANRLAPTAEGKPA